MLFSVDKKEMVEQKKICKGISDETKYEALTVNMAGCAEVRNQRFA